MSRPPLACGHRRRQAGFTLIEMMVASTIALFAMAVALAFFYQSASIAQVLTAKLALNAEARHVMALIGEGHPSIDVTTNIYRGLHGAQEADIIASNIGTAVIVRDTKSRLFLTSTDQAADSNGTQRISDLSITCKGAANPLPTCTGTETLTVSGFVAFAPIVTDDCSDPVDGGGGGGGGACGISVTLPAGTAVRTKRVVVQLADPYMAFAASLGRSSATTAEFSDTYRTTFTQHVDE